MVPGAWGPHAAEAEPPIRTHTYTHLPVFTCFFTKTSVTTRARARVASAFAGAGRPSCAWAVVAPDVPHKLVRKRRLRARSATHAPFAGPKLAAQASSSKRRRSQIFYARNSVCFAHAGDARAQKTLWRFGGVTVELKGREGSPPPFDRRPDPKKKTGHYKSCSPTLQLSNVSACARPRRTVSDLAAADGVAKLYGHVCRWWSWWCTVRGLGGLSIV